MIVEKAGKFCVKSKDGSRGFGCYDTRAAAEKRLGEVEAFKHMDGVQRFDFGEIKEKPTKTPQGFLKIPGNLTRTGVLIYRNADGQVSSRELRMPSEVFNTDSLATLEGAPVTDLHPASLVTPDNVRQLQRGMVASDVKKDGRFVAASVVVQDADLIKAVESGARRELSAGYTCVLEKKDGVWEGEHYDSIQRGIVYNHVAIGPRGWARAGGEVALKMDGHSHHAESSVGHFVRDKLSLMNMSEAEAALKLGIDEWAFGSFLGGYFAAIKKQKPNEPMNHLVKESDLLGVASLVGVSSNALFDLVPMADRADSANPGKQRTKMEPKIIRVDGIDYKVDEAAAPHIEKAIRDRDEKIAKADAAKDAAAVRADAAESASKELKAKLDAAENPERVAALVNERVAIETKARAILGAEEKLDGLDNKAVKVKAIQKADPKVNLDGKADAYIDARFDLLDAATGAAGSAAADLRALEAGRRDAAEASDPVKAKEKMDAGTNGAWKTPLAYSKDAPAKA